MELKFSTVRERDMDLLFLEAISADHGFARLVVNNTKWEGADFAVESIELSRTETDLGESDITVIISVGGNRYGILIEDKIDAPAMPHQHDRYVERGKKGVSGKEFNDFDVMILCPEKYHSSNEEAKRYERYLSYEECMKYFKAQPDETSAVRYKQICSAIMKAKKPSEVVLNEAANAFFLKYREYQRNHYPQLELRSKESSNGWWTQYATRYGQAYILHKIQEGNADLTFPNAAVDIDSACILAKWLREHGMNSITAVRTGKSAALRITVPPLKVKEPFEYTSEENIGKCFEAISVLSELTDILACAEKIKGASRVKP